MVPKSLRFHEVHLSRPQRGRIGTEHTSDLFCAPKKNQQIFVVDHVQFICTMYAILLYHERIKVV